MQKNHFYFPFEKLVAYQVAQQVYQQVIDLSASWPRGWADLRDHARRSANSVKLNVIYGLRYKIEVGFKQAVRTIGTYAYHFWMMDMKPLRRRQGNQYLHRETKDYREKVLGKIHAYHIFVHVGIVAQGLLQYLSIAFPERVWNSFGSWLRTIRPGIPPSELVTKLALKESFPEFLMGKTNESILMKFIRERVDLYRSEGLRLVS